jgi:6-phosphogluconolactonase (cycloisomerase 2 family)
LGALTSVAASYGQVQLYVPTESSNQLWEYGITSGTGNLFNYPIQPVAGNQPHAVAVTPNNRFMFVGEQDGTVEAFVVNYDGTLTPVGPPFANSGSVRGVAVDPSGRFLYTSDNAGSTLRVFSINQTTGQLTALPAFTVALGVGAAPRGVTTDNAGHLYVALAGAAFNSVAQYNINSATGALSLIAAPVAAGATPERIAVTPNGQHLYVTNYFGLSISVYSVNSGTGALTANGAAVSTGSPSRPFGVTVHDNGQFLIVSLNALGITNNVNVYSIAGNGLLTLVSSTAAGAEASGVALDPSGNYLYVANFGSNNITKFNFNPGTGALSGATNFASGIGPQFLLARPAPVNPTAIPTLSTWSFVGLGFLLAASSALLYRRSYR